MRKAHWTIYPLKFNFPAGTSRGILTQKDSYFLFLEDDEFEGKIAVGECGLIKGLSYDDRPGFEKELDRVCRDINQPSEILLESLRHWPAIRFGLEMALADLQSEEEKIYFPGDFTAGKSAIPINGLIWMGAAEKMRSQIEEKIDQGFRCIKIKIGAIDFSRELELIRHIRNFYSSEEMEIRVDANGAFSGDDVFEKLEKLASYQIHSIEQPIKPGNWPLMAELCKNSPVPVALDEELIGKVNEEDANKMLDKLLPPYIILKPGLLGGWEASDAWISAAEERNIRWWATSALESNIGLNAIAQWTSSHNPVLPQGLGTGKIYQNNIPSPLEVREGKLWYDPVKDWDQNPLQLHDV